MAYRHCMKSRRVLALILGAFVGIILALGKHFYHGLDTRIALKTIELFEVFILGVSVRPSSKFIHNLVKKLVKKEEAQDD